MQEEEHAMAVLAMKMNEERMISPASKLRRRWDGVQAVFLIYIAVFVPYRIGFNDDTFP